MTNKNMAKLTLDPHSLTLGTDPRTQAGFFARIWYYITLRPFGNDLLTRAGNGHLLTMAFIMLLVALAEGLAWGYFGSLFTGHQPLIGGIGTGVFVFLLIWSLDRSLVTFDFLEKEHSQLLSTDAAAAADTPTKISKPSPLSAFWTWISQFKGFVFRIGIVALSIMVTAPFLTQLVFKADIENYQLKYYQAAVLAEKNRVINEMQKEQDAQLARLKQATDNLQAEMNGSGGSHRYGFGVNAKSIQQQINTQEERLNQIRNDQRDRVNAIEQAFIAKRYDILNGLGITIQQDSPTLRLQAVKALEQEQRANYLVIERAIIVLLVILAAALFGLKFMQSRTLKLYYSSRLHEKWNLYCLGQFDAHLPVNEQRHILLGSHDALPEEFERLLIKLGSQRIEIAQAEERLRSAAAAAAETRLKAELDRELAQKHSEFSQQQAKQQAEFDRQQAITRDAQQKVQAEQSHYQRLASEKALSEERERERAFVAQQIDAGLQQVSEIEISYLRRYDASIKKLQGEEKQLIDQLLEMEKQFHTQQEQINARTQRIEDAVLEQQDTELLLAELRQGEDRDRIQTLRAITSLENALMRQSDRTEQHRAELLSFQANQTQFEESNRIMRTRLTDLQTCLANLVQPLQDAIKARTAIETRRLQFVAAQGQLDSPYGSAGIGEMPYLIQQLRSKMEPTEPA
jgi:hypothetical protein